MNSQTNVNNLFANAEEDGAISESTKEAINVVDMGAEIQDALGVSVDDISASEVTLVSIMPDDSSSIGFAGNTQIMRDGHNMVLDAFLESKQTQKEGVIMHTRYLNGEVLFPYGPLSDAVRMDESNYNPGFGTPLYDQVAVFLATVLAKSQEFSDAGVVSRSISLIMSDGADMHSYKQNPASVKKLVQDMLRSENHIIAFMGIDDGSTDFRRVAKEMGIPSEWVLTPGNSKSEIRKAFAVFSQSAVSVSQGAVSFSQGALGGFGS